jgi:tryptophanyl-tRNA synthetase
MLEPIQTRFHEIRSDTAELARLLRAGADKARDAAEPTLAQMYDRMGFVAR